jgi:hypothetical protein
MKPELSHAEFLAWHAVNLAEIRLRMRDMFARLDIERQIIAHAERLMGRAPLKANQR